MKCPYDGWKKLSHCSTSEIHVSLKATTSHRKAVYQKFISRYRRHRNWGGNEGDVNYLPRDGPKVSDLIDKSREAGQFCRCKALSFNH